MLRLKRLFSSEKGFASILMAAAMVALAGFAVLVIDAGMIYINKAKISNAVDSAVLAGVQQLPAEPQDALNTAGSYANRNGLSYAEFTFQLGDNNKSITGQANRQVRSFLAGVLGIDANSVAAHSVARIAPVSSTGGVVPFGVLEGNYTFGQQVVLKHGAGDGPYAGWFGALRLGGNGANVYRDNIKYGYDGDVSIGDIIPVEPGNMSGPTKAGVEYRINQCDHEPPCTLYSYVKGCPRILIVPIVHVGSLNDGGHPATVSVVGFAAFLVTQYSGNGNESNVTGSFISYTIPARVSMNSPDFGLYAAQLIE